MSETPKRYSVLRRAGGGLAIIERRRDTFGEEFYFAIAEAVDWFEARKIADRLNAGEATP